MLETRSDLVCDAEVEPLRESIAAARRETMAPDPQSVDLELPGWIWGVMFASYAIFFTGLIGAAGRSAEALFMLVISMGYAVMYFGTAGIMFSVSKPAVLSPFARGIGPLQTQTGPMDRTAVAAQVLTVPLCLAIFGIAAAIIRAVIIG